MTQHPTLTDTELRQLCGVIIAWDDGRGYPPAPSETQRVAKALLQRLDKEAAPALRRFSWSCISCDKNVVADAISLDSAIVEFRASGWSRTMECPDCQQTPDWQPDTPQESSATTTPEAPGDVPWPDPTPEMLNTPEFNAIWDCIKRWDINAPSVHRGYCGATGNHVRAILDALRSRPHPQPINVEKLAEWFAINQYRSLPFAIRNDVAKRQAEAFLSAFPALTQQPMEKS